MFPADTATKSLFAIIRNGVSEDFIDLAFAPATGTPEVGSSSSYEALKIFHKLAGVKIVSADMVEVSPPFDPSNKTDFLGFSGMFDLLCQMIK